MLSRLKFPPPHRLSRHSRSLTLSSSACSADPVSATPRVASQESATLSDSTVAARATSSFEKALEETDSAPPRAKRTKLSPMKTKQDQAVVQTFDAKQLKSFSLYLPPCLPASIVEDSSSLASYTLATTSTYLRLWTLDANMDAIDVSLPEGYSKRLQCDDFLQSYLRVIFNSLDLSCVRSVKELYLPRVSITTTTCSALVDVFQTLSELSCSVENVYLPLSFSVELSTVASLKISKLAKIVQFVTSIKEITLVSHTPLLSSFRDTLVQKIGVAYVKFSISTDDTRESGPEYLTDLGETSSVGEVVSAQSLLNSLNTGTECGGGGGRLLRVNVREKTSSRRVNDGGSGTTHNVTQQQALTTDCFYNDNAELSSDNTYTSQLWDLERLHSSGIDGTGTTIAVLDSGINYTSPAFKDKILAIRNFVPDTIDDIDCAIDSDGHGSLCAGIAAGSSFYCPIKDKDQRSPCLKIPPGVAPEAKLIICKVVKTATGDVDNVAFLNALKWLKEIHTSGTHIDVISISLASSYYSHERAKIISDLVSDGVIVVCCASNVGRMKMQPISYPARLGHVLCIGSHDDSGKPSSFSPVGRELDFLAAGEDIWGPGPGTKGPFAMDCGSGTSCSTPAVAGLVCLVLHDIRQRCTENEDKFDTIIAGKPIADYVKCVWVMRELLKEMSCSPGHHSEENGYGALSPYRLLDSNTEEIVRIVNDIIEDED